MNKFGILTRTGVGETELSKGITVTEAIIREKEEHKGWLDAEVAKSQAIGLIRKLQNC